MKKKLLKKVHKAHKEHKEHKEHRMHEARESTKHEKREHHIKHRAKDAHKKHKGSTMWIAGAIKHPGALHEELHVPKGKKIPAKKLHAAAKKKGIEGKRARLAETLRSFHHKKGK